MKSRKRVFVALIALVLASLGAVLAQDQNNDAIVLTYHKITGEALPNLEYYVQNLAEIRRLSQFDQHDAIQSGIARIQQQLASSDSQHEFTMNVNDNVSQYDFNRNEFTIFLFKPGSYVPLNAFGQQYQLVFANPESLRALQMPKEQAREFDAALSRTGRSVVDEIHFRVIGKGDPAGAVNGPRVIRAEILSAKVLDASGHVLLSPSIAPSQAAPSGAAGKAIDFAKADIAGFQVGVKAKDLEASLTRLFGPVRRTAARPTDWYAGTLNMNEMGCMNLYGNREAKPGAVCVVAQFDRDEVVRTIRIERVFQYFDPEVFRTSLIQKYGPVGGSANLGRSYALGWGPEINPGFLYDRSGPKNALTAHYATNEDYISRSGNSINPPIRVVLYLVDAQWVSARQK